MSFAAPWVLLAFPCLALALWLLERWRRRPLALLVADAELFRPDAQSEREARAARRQLALRFWLRLAALALLCLAAAAPRQARGARGALVLDLVCDRGLSSGAREPSGATPLEAHRAELAQVLERLRPEDRVRLHLVPGPGSPRPLTPAAAAEVLAAARPAGLEAGAALAGLLPALLAPAAGPPVFLASDRPPPRSGSRLEVALRGAPYADRGITSLRLEGTIAYAALWGAPGPVEVRFAARVGPGGEEAGAPLIIQGRVRGQLQGQTPLLLAWSDPALARAEELSARLIGTDALAEDDVAFALSAAAPPRRVGLVGELGESAPALLRALSALPGVTLERLSALPPHAEAFDLLVLERLPEVLPAAPIAVVPATLATTNRAGGRLAPGRPHPAFPHSAARLSADPGAVERVGLPPAGLPQAEALLLAGEVPLVLLSGSPRPRVLVCTAPTRGPWTRREVFPLLWAELLQAAAPRAPREVAALRAGAQSGAERAPFGPPQRVERGARRFGTVAARAQPPSEVYASAFSEEAWARLEAARPPPPSRDLAPWLALLAGLLLCASFWPPRGAPRRPGSGDEGGDLRAR